MPCVSAGTSSSAEVAHKTVAGVLGMLQTIIKHGEDRGLCEPLRFKLPIPKRREFNRTTEWLSSGQLDRLLEVLDDEERMIGNFFKMALFTGMRRGEINKLTWADCDFEFSTLTLRDAKSGRDEVIPIFWFSVKGSIAKNCKLQISHII